MNFFAQQDRARRNTFWLVFLLVAAVVCLIAMTVLTVALVMYFSQQNTLSTSVAMTVQMSWWQHLSRVLSSDILFYASGGVLLVVTGGSFYKMLELGGHGSKIAEALGGELIDSGNKDADKRKILNIVEEMAIASGNPVPPVYLIDDDSINAFAAGTDRRNAVIGVTRGCIHLLSREELQGVIAHEFSHIHFGDMRINLRLVALLHGILVIGLIGSFLLRSSAYGGRNKNRGAQIGLGLAFLILGYGGIFFGNIIKAAVSRQREFLADASAVQFTRNPDGIANALKKIGGLSNHALLSSPVAEEYSHLYFGQGVPAAFGGLMATHPPLEIRIKRVQPNWDGEFIVPDTRTITSTAERSFASDYRAQAFQTMASSMSMMSDAVETIGNPTTENLAAAESLIAALPQNLYDAAHHPSTACVLIYNLLLDKDSESCRQKQINVIEQQVNENVFAEFNGFITSVDKLARDRYLPLIELAMPTLKTLSAQEYSSFKKNLIELIKADNQVSMFEWCLYRIITATIEEKAPVHGSNTLTQVQKEIETVLAAACFCGKTADVNSAFIAAEKHLPNMRLAAMSGAEISFQNLDTAVTQLSKLKPLHKPLFLKALAATIQADKVITAEEGELFRAIADCLDCPIPLTNVTTNA